LRPTCDCGIICPKRPSLSAKADRFHGVCHCRDGVDTLRKQEAHRLHVAPPAERQEDLKRLMWLIRVRPDDRDATNRSKADGLRRVRHWRQRAVKSGLTCFDHFLTLLDAWQELIAFVQHQTGGFIRRRTQH
jgi:hypothetical protein